ncbi:MAG: hypothetical protein ACI9RO_002294 [Alteromonas macleodii]|jgi:hypothetical protein
MASYQQHDDLRLGPLEDVEKKNVRLRREVCLLREVRAVGEAFLYRHLEGKMANHDLLQSYAGHMARISYGSVRLNEPASPPPRACKHA